MKQRKNMWQRMIHKIARSIGLYGTLKSEQALRAKNIEILYLKHEVEQLRNQAQVYVDPSRQAAYDQPSPNTDPALQQRLEARKRQEALQAEILQEQQRKEKMKTFVASITGQPNILTGELPSMTGDLRRKWQTGKLKPITLAKPSQNLNTDDAWTL